MAKAKMNPEHVYRYVAAYVEKHGESPTMFEISVDCDISPTTAFRHLQALVRRKRLKYEPHSARNYHLAEETNG